MTFKEAATRIADHMIVHKMDENNRAIKITEAFEVAIGLLLWADKQPTFLFDDDITEVINEYYNNGLHDGFNRAKKVYKIKD